GLNTDQTCNQHQHCANFYTHVTTLGGIYYISLHAFHGNKQRAHAPVGDLATKNRQRLQRQRFSFGCRTRI
ncbi:MAG: hypothetical protein LRY35_04855, partial [Clostridiales bacterium]|nr:hypothetical protein [Clostridiales bacterium]